MKFKTSLSQEYLFLLFIIRKQYEQIKPNINTKIPTEQVLKWLH